MIILVIQIASDFFFNIEEQKMKKEFYLAKIRRWNVNLCTLLRSNKNDVSIKSTKSPATSFTTYYSRLCLSVYSGT